MRVPGSCGELIQGWNQGGPFLVTCPIDRYTQVRVSDRLQGLQGLGEKAQRALALTLAALGREDFPWGMSLTSELPQGKGMASSSADIAAVSVAAAAALGQLLSPLELLRLAVRIEPTDATFLPGIVALHHMTGDVFRQYRVPPFSLALFDTDADGRVDTLSFHEMRAVQSGRGRPHDWNGLLQKLCGGAREVAEAATLSACWNEDILPKRHFGAVRAAARRVGAPGIIAAHSGTVLGVLLPPQECAAAQAADRLRRLLPQLMYLGRSRIISGGISMRWG